MCYHWYIYISPRYVVGTVIQLLRSKANKHKDKLQDKGVDLNSQSSNRQGRTLPGTVFLRTISYSVLQSLNVNAGGLSRLVAYRHTPALFCVV